MVKKHVTRSLSVVLEDIRVQATLALLDGPYRCARLLGKSLWDFSRTIDELHKTGVSDDQLDFLVAAAEAALRGTAAPSLLPARAG